MKKIQLTKKDIDIKKFEKTKASESQYKTLITEDTIGYHDGEPVIIYKELKGFNPLKLLYYLKKVKFPVDWRLGGLRTVSKIFGFMPREPIKKDYCNATALNTQHLPLYNEIQELAEHLEKEYKEYMPKNHKKHKEATKDILPEWFIGNSLYTSGIINWDNRLGYHVDRANVPDTYNIQYTLKKNIGGGYLSIPEFDIGIELKDNTIVLFKAQTYLHGVTKFKKLAHKSHRYTFVFYSMNLMKKCETAIAELARIRDVKTTREQRRPEERIAARNQTKKEMRERNPNWGTH